MNVLLTGGAGYVGTSLTRLLLEKGYHVICLDNLLNQEVKPLIPFLQDRNYEFIHGDIRDESVLKNLMRRADTICHLAGIIGYPACAKDPKTSEEINVTATRLLESLRSTQQIMINSGTGSVYGKISEVEDMCYETSPLAPVSDYGVQKAAAEKIILDQGNAISLRFATAFGLSPKMRFDLLVNDFCFRALSLGKITIYESGFMRTFIHVKDMARAFLHCIENFDVMKDQAYNCGDSSMNVRKLELAQLVQKHHPFTITTTEWDRDKDQRNYSVSYNKINKTGYKTTISLDKGVRELLSFCKIYQTLTPNE